MGLPSLALYVFYLTAEPKNRTFQKGLGGGMGTWSTGRNVTGAGRTDQVWRTVDAEREAMACFRAAWLSPRQWGHWLSEGGPDSHGPERGCCFFQYGYWAAPVSEGPPRVVGRNFWLNSRPRENLVGVIGRKVFGAGRFVQISTCCSVGVPTPRENDPLGGIRISNGVVRTTPAGLLRLGGRPMPTWREWLPNWEFLFLF